MNAAIVILNWNGAAMMRRFLPSVVAHADGADVIVADNASTDDSIAMLETEFPSVRRIVLKQNHGFAEGYNRAFKALTDQGYKYDYYILLNSDVEVTAGWLTTLVTYMDANPEVAACQPKLLAEYDHRMLEYAGAAGGYIDRDGYPYCRGRIFGVVEQDHGQYDTVADIFWATGAALLIRRTDWENTGGLDGRFFAHNEEIDLCWRLRARDRRIVCIPQSVVYHVGGGTLPKDNPRKTYLNFRNNLLMLYKNQPDKRLRRVMRRRRVLDFVAWFKFVLCGDFGNAAAIRKARRDFKKMRPEFELDRLNNLYLTKHWHYPEMRSQSILADFYLRRKRRFSDL